MPKSTTRVTSLAIAVAGLVALTGCSSSSSGSRSSGSAPAPSSSGTTTSGGSSPAAGLGAVIKPLAIRLGCPRPVVSQPQSRAGAAMGATAGITCSAGANQYVLIQLWPGASASTAVRTILTASGSTAGRIYYVSGPHWLAVGSKATSATLPTRQDAQRIQTRIGGTVGSVSA